MQRLVETLAASLDPVSLVRRAAEQMCLYTPAASGAGITLRDPANDNQLLIVAAHGAVSSVLGQSIPRSEAFQQLAMDTRCAQIVHDIGADPRVPLRTKALSAALDIRSWIATPLLRDGEPIGAVSVVAREHNAFDDAAIAAITSLSNFVGTLINTQTDLVGLFDDLYAQHRTGQTDSRSVTSTEGFVAKLLYPDKIDDDATAHRLDDLFTPGALVPVFQPIVDLKTRETVGVEALSRFPGAPERNVEEWFTSARRSGRGIDLEIHALATILEFSEAIRRDLPVAVNLSPFAAASPEAQDLLLSAGRPVIVELTEHEKFPDDALVALAPLRNSGIVLAIDDVGAGYSTLLQILRLRPDIIKIDAQFTADVHKDRARRVLTTAIVQLAHEIDAQTIAEAIENDNQLDALVKLGVSHGQGYLLGRPQPWPADNT
ncbi:MAG: EAL domain-containing protein [Mycobacterium kyogaense]|uniref:sensor domain-containing phosphodiesterase n=1 Tax=Mycobacterium kyogaense TaxID=2212479 RepID=UPI002FF8DDEB